MHKILRINRAISFARACSVDRQYQNEEMAGVSNDDDGNIEDGHANANDAAVTAEGVDDKCCHHQSIQTTINRSSRRWQQC